MNVTRPTEAGDVGFVGSLWRYPVKSMLGEELNSSVVTDRGLLGDRAFALLDRVVTNRSVSLRHRLVSELTLACVMEEPVLAAAVVDVAVRAEADGRAASARG